MRNEGVVVKPTKKGLGVFAKKIFSPGEVVVLGKIEKRLPERTAHSFQTGPNDHVDLDEPARLINHSCFPNTGIKNNLFGGYDFIALRTIFKGEEITWDYETTEYISIAVKKCLCGSPLCRREIKGFKYAAIEITARYHGFIADYLKTGQTGYNKE